MRIRIRKKIRSRSKSESKTMPYTMSPALSLAPPLTPLPNLDLTHSPSLDLPSQGGETGPSPFPEYLTMLRTIAARRLWSLSLCLGALAPLGCAASERAEETTQAERVPVVHAAECRWASG